MPISTVLIAYSALMGSLSALYYAAPGLATAIMLSVGVVSTAAVLIGVRRHRPALRAPWVMISAGVGLLAAERTVYNVLPGATGSDKPYLIVVNLIHAAAIILMIAAFVRMGRFPVSPRDWPVLLDSAILILGVGLLAWIAVAAPWWEVPTLSVARQWARIVYELLDVLLLAATIRLITTVRRSPSLVLLAVGVAGLLGFSTLFRLGRVRGEWLWGSPIEVGLLAFYAAVAAAALHPSMVGLTGTSARTPHEASAVRLGLVASSSLIPAIMLLAGPMSATGGQVRLVAITVCVMLVLVLARLIGATVSLRRQILIERVVRGAVGEFAAAGDTTSIAAAVARAGEALGPNGAGGRIKLIEPGRAEADGADAAAPAVSAPGSEAGSGAPVRIGALLVDQELAARPSLRPTLEVISTEAKLALERVQLGDQVVRYASERYFGALVENAADVILILDDNDRIRYASPSAGALFGSSSLHDRPLPELVVASERDAARRLLAQVRSQGDKGVGFGAADWTIRAAGGADALAEVSCRDLRADASVRGLVVTLRDVTEQRRLEHDLTKEAFHDPLTGLANRRLFGDRVRQAIDAGAGITGVLAIDLDEFKVVNDGLGHDVGDAVLRMVGRRMSLAVGPTGMAARMGGDEFAVLIPAATAVEDLDDVAARVCESVAEPMTIGDIVVSCRASVGAGTTAATRSPQELLRHADLALYAAKAAGHGQWRHYDPSMTSAIAHRLELRSSLNRAIQDDSLVVQYQPIVALATGQTVGFEALLRWQHPTRGLLSPGEFIEVAEESGVISQIGDWVLATAIEAAVRWRSAAPDPPYVSVNVSPQQFRTAGFVDSVRACLSRTGLPPDRLTLELTESLLLRDDDKVWQDLLQLRGWGVTIAIDDFGTGYSALGYLRQVPLDVVKLDRVFTSTMTTSERQRDLVEGIVRLARALGLSVVAEGIENERERAVALAAGCAYGQGYYFARPMSEAEATRRLRDAPADSVASPR